MMRILLTNDDGIFSEGLAQCYEALSSIAEVWVFAPDRERSASSHSLTLDHPLRAVEVRSKWYAISGTPTDCVNLGVLHFMKSTPPEIVVSGINFGINVGDDVTYSGTVSATFEASILGIPGIAISQELGIEADLKRTAALTSRIILFLKSKNLLQNSTIFNINFPKTMPKGISFCHLGKRHYEESVVENIDPRGKKYFWIGGAPVPSNPEKGTDFEALFNEKISITPLHLDLTNYEKLKICKTFEEDLIGIIE